MAYLAGNPPDCRAQALRVPQTGFLKDDNEFSQAPGRCCHAERSEASLVSQKTDPSRTYLSSLTCPTTECHGCASPGRTGANPTLRFGRDTRAWTLRACRARTLRCASR